MSISRESILPKVICEILMRVKQINIPPIELSVLQQLESFPIGDL